MEHTTQPKSLAPPADSEPELAHNPISPPLATISGGGGGNSSPPRSSHDHEPPETQSTRISSPPLSPLRLNSIPASPSPVHSPDASSISSGHSSCGSHVSSLSEEHLHRLPPETAPSPPHPPEVPVARRLVQEEPKAVTVLDPGAQDAFSSREEVEDRDAAAASNNAGNHDNRRSRRPELSILRRAKRKDTVKRVLLGFRILGFIFCLVSFSVMAADKDQGWAVDSFSRYKEFRYSMAVNVIGCAYSGLQAAELAYKLATGKQTSRNHLRRYYVDFFLDQILAYLLMSSSSSASTRVEDWQSNWGEDKFPSMASASVGLSFTAFVALALSSLASGYLLCTLRSSM